jgi:hypothetical protein
MSGVGAADKRGNRADEPGAVLQAAVDQVLEEAKREALARAAAQLESGQAAAGADAHEAEGAEAERPAPLDPEELLRQAEEEAGIEEVNTLDPHPAPLLIHQCLPAHSGFYAHLGKGFDNGLQQVHARELQQIASLDKSPNHMLNSSFCPCCKHPIIIMLGMAEKPQRFSGWRLINPPPGATKQHT